MAKGSQLTQLKSALSQAGAARQDNNNTKKRKRSQPSAKLQEIHDRLNPFDVKVTKLKHDAGGRKIRGATGRPAQSKQAGIEQRKRTLLREYEEKNRVGGILDRRFGENDPSMNPEERMLERFTKERQRTSRGSAFNLDDDDELTHYGQSLSKLDDFDNTGLALDEDDDEGAGHIDSRTVTSVHFGGFSDEEGSDEGSEPARKRSKAEVMSEVIAKSKEHKALRQMSRQENDELRHELDNELDSIRDLLFTEDPSALLPLEAATLRNKPDVGLPQDTSQPGDPSSSRPSISGKDQAFDQYVRELAFDKRAKPKDRTKTEEELALDEKQRLEKAERRRLRRMQGLDDYDSEPEEVAGRTARARARGGDDLEDDFEDDETMGFGRGLVETPAEGEGTTDDDADGDGDEEEDEDSSEEGEENEEAGSEDEDEDEDGGIEDADLEAEEGEHEELISTTRPPRKVAPDTELPYTFECPDSHEAFLEIIDGIKDSDIPIVIQRIRTLHHPSLAEDNKFKLQVLGSVLIDHVLYAASPPSPNFGVVSSLLPHLAALSRTYPESSATHFLNKLKLMEKNLKHGLAQGALKPKSKTFPGLSELALLRSIGLIWSTSDMNHAVVTPARLLMAAYLGLGRVRSVQDLASGLFVCTLWLQYEDLSARFVPEAVNFAINAVLHLAPHKYDQAVNVPGNFPHPDLGSDLTQGLRISPGDVSSGTVASTVDLVAVLEDTVDAEAAKRQLLSTALNLIGRFSDKFQSLDGFPELFQPVLSVCKGLRSKKLPEQLKQILASLKSKLEDLIAAHLRTRQPLLLQAHKPIPIPSYVPKFETSKSSYFKSQDPDREKNEAAKLRRQYKQEKKGALRELRKDARFLAGVQQEQQQAKDDAYASRMKRVFGSLEGERAEEKQMEKEKARAKKRAGRR